MPSWGNYPDDVREDDPRAPWNQRFDDEEDEPGSKRPDGPEAGWERFDAWRDRQKDEG